MIWQSNEDMNTMKFYNSVAEFSAALDGEIINTYCKKGHGISVLSKHGLKHYAGVESIDEAKELLLRGDSINAAKIRAEGEIIKPRGEHNPILKTAVAGCLPNVPNYLRGVPAQMYQIKNNIRRRPIINIYIEVTVADSTDLAKLAQKAAVISNAIAATELSGYRVNLFAVYGIKNTKEYCAGFCVNIKEADSPLNLLNIAFPLLNPAFSTVLGADWVDKNIKTSMKVGRYVYGYVLHSEEIRREFGINGLFFSLREMIRKDDNTDSVCMKINEYLAK
jgi:hypothetical protein